MSHRSFFSALPSDLTYPIVDFLTPADYTQALCLSKATHLLFSSPPLCMPMLVRRIDNWPAVIWRMSQCESPEQLELLASQFPRRTQSGYPVTVKTLRYQFTRLMSLSYEQVSQILEQRLSWSFQYCELASMMARNSPVLYQLPVALFWRDQISTVGPRLVAQFHPGQHLQVEDVIPIEAVYVYFSNWTRYRMPHNRARLAARAVAGISSAPPPTFAWGVPITLTYLPVHTTPGLASAMWGDEDAPIPDGPHVCYARSNFVKFALSDGPPFTRGRLRRSKAILHQYRECGCITASAVLDDLMCPHGKWVDPRFLVAVWTEALSRRTICELTGTRPTRSRMSAEAPLWFATSLSPLSRALRALSVNGLHSWAMWAYVCIGTGQLFPTYVLIERLRMISAVDLNLFGLRQALGILGSKPHHAPDTFHASRDQLLTAIGERCIQGGVQCVDLVATMVWSHEPAALFRSVKRISELVEGGPRWSRPLRDALDWRYPLSHLDPTREQVLNFQLFNRSHPQWWTFLKLAGKYLGARWPSFIVRSAMENLLLVDHEYHREAVLNCIIQKYTVPCPATFHIREPWAGQFVFRVLLGEEYSLKHNPVLSEYHLDRDRALQLIELLPVAETRTLRMLYGVSGPPGDQPVSPLSNAELSLMVPALLAAGRWNEVTELLGTGAAERTVAADVRVSELYVEYRRSRSG